MACHSGLDEESALYKDYNMLMAPNTSHRRDLKLSCTDGGENWSANASAREGLYEQRPKITIHTYDQCNRCICWIHSPANYFMNEYAIGTSMSHIFGTDNLGKGFSQGSLWRKGSLIGIASAVIGTLQQCNGTLSGYKCSIGLMMKVTDLFTFQHYCL